MINQPPQDRMVKPREVITRPPPRPVAVFSVANGNMHLADRYLKERQFRDINERKKLTI
jgi:hypothetical protein